MNERELSLTGALHKEFLEFYRQGEAVLKAKLRAEKGPWTRYDLSVYITQASGIPEKVANDILGDYSIEGYLQWSFGPMYTSGIYRQS